MGISLLLFLVSVGQQSNAFKQTSFFTWKVYTCIHLLGHFKLECLTIVRKKVCNLKSKCQNWNIIWRLEVKLCFIYILSKIVKFSTLTFIFRLFFLKYRRNLPENESDFTPRNFNRRVTIWWVFIQEVPCRCTKIRAGAMSPNVNISAYRKCICGLYPNSCLKITCQNTTHNKNKLRVNYIF